jgi:hypothetical protein
MNTTVLGLLWGLAFGTVFGFAVALCGVYLIFADSEPVVPYGSVPVSDNAHYEPVTVTGTVN